MADSRSADRFLIALGKDIEYSDDMGQAFVRMVLDRCDSILALEK